MAVIQDSAVVNLLMNAKDQLEKTLSQTSSRVQQLTDELRKEQQNQIALQAQLSLVNQFLPLIPSLVTAEVKEEKEKEIPTVELIGPTGK